MRGSGLSVAFTGNGSGIFTPDASSNDRLLSVPGGYRYFDAAAQAVESYDSTGLLLRIDMAGGASLVYVHSTGSTPAADAPEPGYLLSVTDSAGRSVRFQYDVNGRITNITDPANETVVPSYDGAGNLVQLRWQDGKARKFVYENSKLPWALTGIVDEADVRFATITYDPDGRAISSALAGDVDKFSVTYTEVPTVVVTDTHDETAGIVRRSRTWQAPVAPQATVANGNVVNYGVGTVAGRPGIVSKSQPAGAGCAASTQAHTVDANGNAASVDNFNGSRSCYAHDLSRNLETLRVEGLEATVKCSTVVGATAAVPAGARKTSTQWHPDVRLSTKVAVPGTITTSIYNGQPDPFSGNAVASCAPAGATLPDGKPIAVLCKQVVQSTTDTDGHLGFSAALQAGVSNRVSTWTYNNQGRVLTAKGPRTAVNNTTTYTYYTDTTADHTLGDLKTMTNSSGKVTSYDKYNKLGQLLQSTDPNGILTINTYDLRQRLKTSSVGGETTTYTYDDVGQLTKVAQADGSWVGYEYDDAHRQTAVKDNLSNRIDYQLDNSGIQTGQTVKDPTGSLRRNLARVMDALGRAQQASGGE